MIATILQVPAPSQEEIAARADTVKAHLSHFAEELVNDPAGAMSELGFRALDFGIKVVVAILIYVVGIWLIGRIKKGLNNLFLRKNTDKTVATFTSSFISVTLTVLLIVVTVGTLGVDTTSLAALLAAGGVALGMALSGTVQNFAGGIMILVFKPFKVGDVITAQGYTGTVTYITIVNTSLQTGDNHTILVPNGALFNGTIDNITCRQIRRVEWTIGLEYNTDADACIAAILEILKSDSRILDATEKGADNPFAGIVSLSASSVDFIVRAWVRTDDFWPVFFEIQKTLYTELPQKGFSFPFPQLDVRVKN